MRSRSKIQSKKWGNSNVRPAELCKRETVRARNKIWGREENINVSLLGYVIEKY